MTRTTIEYSCGCKGRILHGDPYGDSLMLCDAHEAYVKAEQS